jgi:hypothetical protein
MALETPESPAKKTLPKNAQYIIGAVIVIAALVPSVYFYTQYQQAQSRLANPNLFAAEEAKKYIDQVAKLMILPTGETPTLATVNDKDKLKGQPFFANAENGDKVLIYSTAKKAILFRPSLNKIIDVAPINVAPTEASGSATQNVTPAPVTIKFVIRNGTKTVGLTKTYETELMKVVTNAEVVDRDNAKTTDFTKSLLVDVKGTKSTEATQLATQLGLSESPIPAGESTPAADFLIILGSDKSK